MATVTESSLLTAAHEIVDAFMDKSASLNDGVIKKASELGLNNDQTQRLIERTNTEAFLRVYPSDTDFEVASPEVVLGIKTASIVPTVMDKGGTVNDDGLFKAAHVQEDYFYKKASSKLPSRYQTKVASVSEEDIFGMDDEFYKEAEATKYASAIDPENMARGMRCWKQAGSRRLLVIVPILSTEGQAFTPASILPPSPVHPCMRPMTARSPKRGGITATANIRCLPAPTDWRSCMPIVRRCCAVPVIRYRRGSPSPGWGAPAIPPALMYT